MLSRPCAMAMLGVLGLLTAATVGVAVGPAAAAIVGGDTAVVTNVVDGDTVDVRFPDGTTDRVRFKGIDTPESGSTQPDYGEFGSSSGACQKNEGNDITAYLQHLEGESVTLRYDSKGDRRGYFDRLLAYVYFEGVNYNYMLVETGRARVTTEYPMSNQSRYTTAAAEAKAVNRGVWRCTGNGSVDIERVNPNPGNLSEEYLALETTGASVDLSGWTLSDGDGNSYTFPAGTGLGPNETLRVYTGRGENDADPAGPVAAASRVVTTGDGDRDVVYWNRSTSVWSDGFENVTLTTPDGTIASSRFYRSAPVEDATNDASDVNWTGGANRTRDVGRLERVTGTFQGSEDGDTVTVTIDGEDRSVDLVGVVWPKSNPYKKGFEDVPDNTYGGNCLTNEAEESDGYPLYERMQGEQVTLYFDPVKGKVDNSQYDGNGNLHAYLHYRGVDVNRKLIAEGAARMHYGKFLRNPEYSRVEAFARQDNRDVWRCQNADKGGIGRVDVETVSADPEGPDYASLDEEYIVLETLASQQGGTYVSGTGLTNSREPVDLSGWTVSDGDGNSYTFGDVTLDPGETLVLHTGGDPGPTAPSIDTEDAESTTVQATSKHVYWDRSTPVWDNDADTVTVTAPDGRVATTRPYDYLTAPPSGEDLTASGARSDDGDVFTKGQTNRVDVTVRNFSGPATRVAVTDSVPEGWRVLDAGDARNSGDVRTVDLGVVTRAELEAAKAEGKAGVTLTYFVEANRSSARGTFGPATATVLDRTDAYSATTAEFGGTDTNTVVGVSSEP